MWLLHLANHSADDAPPGGAEAGRSGAWHSGGESSRAGSWGRGRPGVGSILVGGGACGARRPPTSHRPCREQPPGPETSLLSPPHCNPGLVPVLAVSWSPVPASRSRIQCSVDGVSGKPTAPFRGLVPGPRAGRWRESRGPAAEPGRLGGVGATWWRGPAPAPAPPAPRTAPAGRGRGDPGSARVLRGASSGITASDLKDELPCKPWLPPNRKDSAWEVGLSGEGGPRTGCKPGRGADGGRFTPWEPLRGAAGTRAPVSAAEDTEAQKPQMESPVLFRYEEIFQ
ncbi:unnamed protein product [Nyctereutes procyonoides]|uniref:(raccoon dog) hypothetical protein n=1 Tax=Nyctereutes procyonoides TaxID=34880 RepID=A0A811YPT2_NYCPR|nr:unnamed protein product [Nyctereutes procyonoides]